MNFKFETKKLKQGYIHVIGCDEVGRGCLAGPVVAAAVVFAPASLKRPLGRPERSKGSEYLKGIKDSKLLSADKRQKLSEIIKQHALWGIGVVGEKTIDEINIHHATLLAMKRAVEGLVGSIPSECSRVEESVNNRSLRSRSDALTLGRDGKPFLYIDGKFTIPGINIDQEAVVGGDNKILSVAAASIIAKVYRDDLMRKLDKKYPIYNFAQHKGYGTLFHRTMILENGLSAIHRRSFCSQLV